MSDIHYKDLNGFLSKHNAKAANKNKENIIMTHTRIPDTTLNIYGGSYIIPKEDLSTFMALYYQSVFVNKKMEYLTERQVDVIKGDGSCGPIMIDVDLRYSYDIDTRQHTSEHILDLVNLLYLEEIKNIFIIEPGKSFPIYIFEKPNVNRLADGSLTKDGIHIIIGIQMDHVLQVILRERVVSKIGEYWDLPLINDWESVFDEGISKGTTNWQMFGSRKPGNQAYELTQYYVAKYESIENQFTLDEKNAKDFEGLT